MAATKLSRSILTAVAFLSTVAACSNEPQSTHTKDESFVTVIWRKDGIALDIVPVTDPAGVRCNGLAPNHVSTLTTLPDAASIDLDAQSELDISCSITGVGSFHLTMPGVDRDSEGKVLRSATSVPLLAQCEPVDHSLGATFGTDPQRWESSSGIRCPKDSYTFETNSPKRIVMSELGLTW